MSNLQAYALGAFVDAHTGLWKLEGDFLSRVRSGYTLSLECVFALDFGSDLADLGAPILPVLQEETGQAHL